MASELGKGTRITILLPRKEAAPAAEDAEAAETGGSGTVLLVEDNPEVASVSTNLLEQLGYTVRRVANAEAALREIELDGIDLVFSDIVMPGKMDGLGLARHLKAVRPGLPILLTSGYSDAALNVRGDFPSCASPTKSTNSARRSRNCRGDGARPGSPRRRVFPRYANRSARPQIRPRAKSQPTA